MIPGCSELLELEDAISVQPGSDWRDQSGSGIILLHQSSGRRPADWLNSEHLKSWYERCLVSPLNRSLKRGALRNSVAAPHLSPFRRDKLSPIPFCASKEELNVSLPGP